MNTISFCKLFLYKDFTWLLQYDFALCQTRQAVNLLQGLKIQGDSTNGKHVKETTENQKRTTAKQ